MLLTLDVEILGKTLDRSIFKKFESIKELLDFKNNVLVDKYVEIEVVDLCEFIDSLKYRIKLLKMDVEGVECRILKKLINTGQIRKIDYVFVETHEIKIPELKSETEEIRNLLKERKIRNVNLDWN